MLQQYNPNVARIVKWIIQQLNIPLESLVFEGHIRFRLLPQDWTQTDYEYWWLPEYTSSGSMIRPARMNEKEKSRFTVHQVSNILTAGGRSLLLQYASSTAATTPAFAQYFATGTTIIAQVSAGDTSLAGENARVATGTPVISGNTVDCTALMGVGAFSGTLTNAALFGVNATGSANSGTMVTHSLLNNFFKITANAYSVDYLISIN